MTQTEKEQYELTIKNMQSKIDWLRDQRKLMDTYGKKYEPLTDEQYEYLVEDLAAWSHYVEVDTAYQTLNKHVRQVLAAHGIKE